MNDEKITKLTKLEVNLAKITFLLETGLEISQFRLPFSISVIIVP